jgi:hypothetical protein
MNSPFPSWMVIFSIPLRYANVTGYKYVFYMDERVPRYCVAWSQLTSERGATQTIVLFTENSLKPLLWTTGHCSGELALNLKSTSIQYHFYNSAIIHTTEHRDWVVYFWFVFERSRVQISTRRPAYWKDFFRISSVPPGQCQDSTAHRATTVSF